MTLLTSAVAPGAVAPVIGRLHGGAGLQQQLDHRDMAAD
jgi:hypothetical protein